MGVSVYVFSKRDVCFDLSLFFSYSPFFLVSPFFEILSSPFYRKMSSYLHAVMWATTFLMTTFFHGFQVFEGGL